MNGPELISQIRNELAHSMSQQRLPVAPSSSIIEDALALDPTAFGPWVWHSSPSRCREGDVALPPPLWSVRNSGPGG
jgi:hypothetical protein